MRNWFGWALAGVLLAGAAQAQITITGEASIFAAPDMATVTLGVTTQEISATAALQANSLALNAVLARLEAADIAAPDLQTSNLQLAPIWTNNQNADNPRISGYTASHMVTVRVRDLSRIGDVLDAAVADGANTLNGIAFAQSDPRPSQDAARKAAVADAMARARVLTDAAGVTLGQLLTISENTGYAPHMMKTMAFEDALMPIASGEIAVTASVVMVFELVQ